MLQLGRSEVKYIYDLPYAERRKLCQILDQNDKWEVLGGQHMKFHLLDIQTFRREKSPTDELLTRWGHKNHTVLELFVLLSKMQHYQAMMVIKEFVDSQYHPLIYEGEGRMDRIYRRATAPPHSEITLTKTYHSSTNFNHSRSSNDLPAKMEGLQTPTSDTESKILNIDVAARVRTNSRNHGAVADHLSRNNNGQRNQSPRPPNSPTMRGHHSSAKDKTDMSIGVENSGLPLIPFKELEQATNGWDSRNIVGKGGFGTVYRGEWKNTTVAVKRTKNPETDVEQHSIQMEQMFGELRMLNSYRHDNILPLYGFSMGGEDPCLVYQFMPNGSLEDRLFCRQETPPLTWEQRMKIARLTARGLQYLHIINTEKPLVHGDIKSANILLDSNFEPKIGDFGLAREGPSSQYTHVKVSRVHGTRPYLPDEFLRLKKFSTKVDTHCFGIVLFELITGLRAYDTNRKHKMLRDHIQNATEPELLAMFDKKAGPEEPYTYSSLLDLGTLCVKHNPKLRPEMDVCWQTLEEIANQRGKIVNAKQQLQQNRLNPTTPYEIQLQHDYQSHLRSNNASPIMRNHSPVPEINGITPRAYSPAGSSNARTYERAPTDVVYPLGSPHRGYSPVPYITVTPQNVLSTARAAVRANTPPQSAVASPSVGSVRDSGASSLYLADRSQIPETVPVGPLLPATLPPIISTKPSTEFQEDDCCSASQMDLQPESPITPEESHFDRGMLPRFDLLGIEDTVAGASNSAGSSQNTGSTVKAASNELMESKENITQASNSSKEQNSARSSSQCASSSAIKAKPLWILGEGKAIDT